MLDRIRDSLVESFVGAIVVAWLLADGLIRLTEILTSPILSFAMRQEFGPVRSFLGAQQRFPFEAALPPAIGSALLLLMGYGLLRWLYYPRTEREASGEVERVNS